MHSRCHLRSLAGDGVATLALAGGMGAVADAGVASLMVQSPLTAQPALALEKSTADR
jgi:hypothetical protein